MSFFVEIKRRKVFQAAAIYGIVAWLLVQIVTAIEAPLNLPDWADTLVIVLLAIGFPIVLIMSWVFDLTPDGLVRDDGDSSSSQSRGPRIEYALIVLLAVAVAYLLIDDYVLDKDRGEPTAAAANVTEQPSGTSPPASQAPATATASTAAAESTARVLPDSVAVLPFENLSPDPENAYFAAGIHEEVLNEVAKLRNLSVVSRTSVLRYANSQVPIPEIVRELNVETVMEGSVRYAGTRVRISAQLIEAATDRHLWSEVYERDLSDIFAIQADIAMNIANALQAEFSDAEQQRLERAPTDSPEAYALYLRAIDADDPADKRDYLLQAIDADPEFALAYGRLAMFDAFVLVNSDGSGTAVGAEDTAAAVARSREYAERAIAIDSTVRYAHSALAVPAFLTWRWTEAEQAFARALEAAPNDSQNSRWYGYLLNYLGRPDEAIALAERARELNPDNPFAGGYPVQLGYAGQYARAAELIDDELARFPRATTVRNWSAMMALAQGDTAKAAEQLAIVERIAGDNRLFVSLPEWAYGYGRIGRRDDARRIFDEIAAAAEAGADPGAGGWARAYLAIGDEPKALEWLGVAAEKVANHEPDAGFFNLMNLKMNITRDPVLEQPEFVEVLSRIRGD